MSGFSLDLKAKGKKSIKKKRSNVFGEEAQDKKKTKIRLTHVDEYRGESEKKLVIKPETLRSSFFNDEKSSTTGPGETKPKYGLIVDDGNQEDDKVKNQEHINLQLPNKDLLPEITKTEEYDEVPIEEFGDALLRGMGWDGKDDEKDNDNLPAPKPQLLGIGARAPQNLKNTGKDREQEDIYIPLVKVDKKSE